MKLATSTGDFRRFCQTREECIRHLYEAGFRYIDLSQYVYPGNEDLLLGDDWMKCVDSLKACADSLGMTFVQSHSPGGNGLKHDENYDRHIAATIRSIEVCGALGIPNIVVHGGHEEGISKDEYFERNKEFYSLFIPAMEKWGVNVLFENSHSAPFYWANSGADVREFVKYMDHPLFHACWDTGHANIDGPQYDEIMTLGDELHALHVNDNRGTQDEHVPPYFGTINMDEVMTALIDSGYKGYFTYECGAGLRSGKVWIGNRRTFERDTRLFEPTLAMQKEIEKFMYDMGVYFLKSYNCFEE